jgi:putative transcriptional regulator
MKRSSIGQRAIAGAREALAHASGDQVPGMEIHQSVDVAALRGRMNLTQSEFANRFGLSAATLRDWEQKRRTPEAPARLYLRMIEKEPEAVLRALSSEVSDKTI